MPTCLSIAEWAEISPTAWLLALLVTAFAALIQGSIGLGFAVTSVPLTLLIDPQLAPGPQLLLTVPLTVATCWRERQGVQIRSTLYVLAGRIPGAFLGILLLQWATGSLLQGVIGIIVLLAALILATPIDFQRTKGAEFMAGVGSGIGSMVAAIGGPPLALIFSRSPGPELRSNLAFIFAVGVLITISLRWGVGELDGQDLRMALLLLPGLVAGFTLSNRLKNHFAGGTRLRLAVCALSMLAALTLLGRAFGSPA